MTTVLVAGGAGFIGSHLCERLLELGYHVICLDNFNTGSRDNIAHLECLPLFELLEQSVCESLSLNVDLIYNLACPASPQHYQSDPVDTVKTSVLGAINLLDLARSNNARILQASTSEVYGDPQVHPQSESYNGNVNPIGPRACYDEGKRCAETLFADYQRQYGLDIRIARIFNTYGPRMQPDDGRVVSNFVMQALNNTAITLYGSGEQTRSFCYVEDMVNGLIALMAHSHTGPVNLGNPEELSMLALAQRVCLLCGSDNRFEFFALPADDPVKRRPDVSLAKQLLQWTPVVSLEDGLEKTINYFRANSL